MTNLRKTFLLFLILLSGPHPTHAQVEKIAMRTTGISCGISAGLSEIYFHRLPGIDQVKISLKNEAIMLTYESGAAFDPQAIRKVLEPLKVGVVQFQISVRGEVRETGGKRLLRAGKDTFVVRDTIDAPTLPLNTPLRIEAILFDHLTPMEVKALNFQAASLTGRLRVQLIPANDSTQRHLSARVIQRMNAGLAGIRLHY